MERLKETKKIGRKVAEIMATDSVRNMTARGYHYDLYLPVYERAEALFRPPINFYLANWR